MTATNRADCWIVGDNQGGHVVWPFDEAQKGYAEGWTVIGMVTEDHRLQSLREAAEKWRRWTPGGCPTCEADPMSRETVGLVCQTCGHDHGEEADRG